MKRYPKILDKNKSALLIIDVQERILKVMQRLENTLKLIRGCKTLNVPVYYTEQYPKGLGETAQELKSELESTVIQKMSFSCSGAGNLFEEFKQKGFSQIIVCGIACVCATNCFRFTCK